MTVPLPYRAAALLPLLFAAACDAEADGGLAFAAATAWPTHSLLPPVEGPRLAVSNSGEDTVSFVDPVSFEEIGRVPVGIFPVELEGAHHLAPTPDGRFLFVGIANTVEPGASAGGPHGSHGTGTADGYLIKIDAVTGRQLGRARVDRSPGDVRLQPGTMRVWQSHYDLVTLAEAEGDYAAAASSVVVTDGATMERIARVEICPSSHGIGFAPDGSQAYVSCGYSDELAIVDTASFEVRIVPVAEDAGTGELFRTRYLPYALTVAPDGLVWVSSTSPLNPGLRVIDPAAGAELPERALPLEGTPLFGDFTADGSRLYLPMQGPDRLVVVDPAAGSILESVELGPLGCENPHAAVLSADESELWVVCEGDRLSRPGSLERFRTEGLTPTGHVELGLFPDDVVLVPEAR